MAAKKKKDDAPPATLEEAVRRRDVAAVKSFLDNGADPNVTSPYGTPLLHEIMSIEEDDAALAILDLFLAAGVSPDVPDAYGQRVLFSWAYSGLERGVERLLAAGARLEGTENADKHTLLHCAAASGSLALVERCLAAKQRPNQPCAHGHTPMHYAVDAESWRKGRVKPCQEVLERLLMAGGNLHKASKGDWGTPLHWACARGTTDVVATLLSLGARVGDRTERGGELPLHQAAWWGSVETVETLLHAGADVHATDNFGWAPLHFAALNKDPAVALLLRSRGANPLLKTLAACNRLGTTIAKGKLPLEIAKRKKAAAVVSALEP